MQLLLLCILVWGCATRDEVVIEVRNDLPFDRSGEIVSLSWSDVQSWLPEASSSETGVFHDESGRRLLVQFVDADANGTPEDLLFLADVPSRSAAKYRIASRHDAAASDSSLTDARFVTPRQDLAWENDRIAFRMYGPAMAAGVNNGIDVWTKRVRYRIVEKWYKLNESSAPGKDSYHEDHGEGADFFSVGSSLGAGGSALWDGRSLVQPGVFSSYKVLSTGPLRAAFELRYPAVSLGGDSVQEVKRIELDAGENLNRIVVRYSTSGRMNVLTTAVGIVKRDGVSAASDSDAGWLSLYGLTTANEVDRHLGTGIVLPPGTRREIREDDRHLMAMLECAPESSMTYYSGAGWTRSGDFDSQKNWEEYLAEFSDRLKTPLRVSLLPQ